jgi:hypothetical protein
MKRLDLLRQITFGAQVAEEEATSLASYFVETNDWARVTRGEIDIVRGDKGAGKSAIYSLLLAKSGEFFDNRIILIPAENPRGATVFKDLSADPPTTEVEFITLWKLYILALVARELREYAVISPELASVFRALEDANLLEREFNPAGLLRRVHEYARRIVRAEALEGGLEFDPITQMPSGIIGRIVLKEPSTALRNAGLITIDSLLSLLDIGIRKNGWTVWILFDRLDIAFADNHALEANALRALIRAYLDFKAYDNIVLKIFLREDIWTRIVEGGFREYSHIVKYIVLSWNEDSLLNLLMRRLLSNEPIVTEFNINASAVLDDYKRQERLFYQFFPDQVEQGPQKAKTFKWLITRCADGTKKTAPRELIHLVNSIRDSEIKRLEVGGTAADGLQLFDRSVFKLALPIVSHTRLTSYLYAEYPNTKQFISSLEGQKTEQTTDSLSALWSLSRPDALVKARELTALGLFEEHGSRDQPTFWVPFLYREALSLVQGRAEPGG